MQTIYIVHCEIITGGLVLRRKFFFPMREMRDAFIANPPDNVIVYGYGIDYLMDVNEAVAECVREQQTEV